MKLSSCLFSLRQVIQSKRAHCCDNFEKKLWILFERACDSRFIYALTSHVIIFFELLCVASNDLQILLKEVTARGFEDGICGYAETLLKNIAKTLRKWRKVIKHPFLLSRLKLLHQPIVENFLQKFSPQNFW